VRKAGGRPYLHGQFALGRILDSSWQKGGPGARARPKHEIANAWRRVTDRTVIHRTDA